MSSSTHTPLVPPTLRADFDHCRDITYRFGPNFSVGFRFLPKDKKNAVFSAYAFCRYADDLADEGSPRDDSLLASWEEELHNTYRGLPGHPITRALARTLERYPIPMSAFEGLIEGCRWDFVKNRYRTFQDLLGYCDLVAATISDISLSIFGALDPAAFRLGRSLSYALQMTNILRDIGEDTRKDRIYIPLEDLETFSISEADILERTPSDNYRSLIDFQVKRTETFFNEARRLPDLIEKDSCLTVRLMAGVYEQILKKIKNNPNKPLKGETFLTFPEKCALVARLLLFR